MNDFVDKFKQMPWPLRILTLLSLTSILLLVSTVVPGGAIVGQRRIGIEQWWTNGSGLLFTVAVCLFTSGGLLLLKARRLGRAAYISGFAALYVSGYFIDLINGAEYSSKSYLYDLFFAVLQIAALSAYLFLNQRVKKFLVD